MKLLILGSSSHGNGYILKGEKESLIIECGVRLLEAKKAMNFDLSSVVASLCTHEHGDHSKYAKDYAAAGIDVFSTQGTLEAIGLYGHRAHVLPKCSVMLSGFKVLAFGIKHDAKDPVGFLIHHPECGNVLFLTDTFYCPFKFRNLNQLIVECNFADDILGENILNGAIHPSVANRSRENHMSMDILKDLLSANDLSQVNNICLIHLSSQNSDSRRFQKEITELTGKTVTIAEKGLEIEFNLIPF